MQQGLSEELYNHIDDYRDREEFTEPEKLAIEFAERFVFSHREIDDAFFDQLRQHFDDQQIVELTTTIGFCLGIGRTLAILDIANDCPVNLTAEPTYDHG